MLDQTTEQREKANICQMLEMVKGNQGKHGEAVEFYEKSIKINQKIFPPTHSDLFAFYNNIGSVYYDMKEYSKALSYYERALNIRQRSLPPNHSHLEDVKESIEIVKWKL